MCETLRPFGFGNFECRDYFFKPLNLSLAVSLSFPGGVTEAARFPIALRSYVLLPNVSSPQIIPGKRQRLSFFFPLAFFTFSTLFCSVWSSRDKTSLVALFMLCCFGFFLGHYVCTFLSLDSRHLSVVWGCVAQTQTRHYSVIQRISHHAIIVVHKGLFSRPSELLPFTWPTAAAWRASRATASPQSFVV